MSILRHSAWAAAAAIVLTGSRFAFVAIIARRLSMTEFGQYAYGQWLADLSFLLCSLGATGAVGRYVAEFRNDPALTAAFIRRWLPFAIGLPWLAAAVVPLGAWLSGMSIGFYGLFWLVLWALASGLWAMQTAALSGLQRFDLIFFGNAVAAAILVGGALLLPSGSANTGQVFALMALSCCCASLVGFSTTRRLAGHVPAEIIPARWRAMQGYALNIWLSALLWSLVWSRGEMPIVRAYLGDVGVAHYAAALTLFGGGMQGVMLATSGVAPQLTRLWGEGSHTQALDLARRVMDVQLLVCGLAAIVLICFSPELMRLAFGGAYGAESGSLAILSLGLVALAVSCQNHLLQIATDARFSRDSTLLGLFVLFGSALLLVSVAGLAGAASARAGTMLVMAAVSLLVMHRRWGGDAYSGKNFAWVFLLVASCLAIQRLTADLHWFVRAGLCSVTAAVLVAAVRDERGRTQTQVVLERLRSALWPSRVATTQLDKP